jgi:hypothetical protein
MWSDRLTECGSALKMLLVIQTNDYNAVRIITIMECVYLKVKAQGFGFQFIKAFIVHFY